MGSKAPAGLLAESMAVGLVPPHTVPTQCPPFPWQSQTAFHPPLWHSGSVALPPSQLDILCSAWLEGLPGVFHNPWALRGISVLHAGDSVPVMGGALSHRKGVEGDSKLSSTPEILWLVD